MNLHKLILTSNACYKTGDTITPKGIMVHSTGANNPNLRRYVGPDDSLLGPASSGNWNTATPGEREVCVHAFIGKLVDGSIATYQTLPWNMRSWHAGGPANDSYIGFEICEDNLTHASYFSAVYHEAVELCVYLCKLYGLTERDIICHSEGYQLGIASNHSDVMHWFPRYGKSMDTFRAEVKTKLTEMADIEMSNKILDNSPADWEEESVNKALEKGILKGDENGNLMLHSALTRAQLMVFLDRLGLLK